MRNFRPQASASDTKSSDQRWFAPYLREQKYVVTAVNDGTEALRMLMGERFDGVIIDAKRASAHDELSRIAHRALVSRLLSKSQW